MKHIYLLLINIIIERCLCVTKIATTLRTVDNDIIKIKLGVGATSNLVISTVQQQQSVSQFDCLGLGEQPLDAEDKEHRLVLSNTRRRRSAHPLTHRVEQRSFRRRTTHFGDHDETS